MTILLLIAVSADPTPAEARQRWLRGNAAEARELYSRLADPVAAAIGLSHVEDEEGHADRALAAIDAALAKKSHPDLHACRAELLHRRGQWDDALAAADAALKLRDDHFHARWVRACVWDDRGELDKADAEFRWFVRTYTARNRARQDVKNADELLLVARAGAENARRHKLADQFRFILNEVVGDAVKADPDLWMAEELAGRLLLEKYNKPEALAAFDKALAINPRAAAALVGKGEVALAHHELNEAEELADRALEARPRFPPALRLKADIRFAAGLKAETVELLNQARAAEPRDVATLGRLAAVAWLTSDREHFAAIERDVSKYDAKPGRFYAELAGRLDQRQFYDDAESFYRKALQLRPHLHAAANQLGLLALRMGREPEAKQLLTQAFDGDRFNVRVANSLKVLRHLDGYSTIRTPQFEFRYDAKTDAVLGPLFAEYLEAEYAKLAAKYRHEPKGPLLVELFGTHEMFSGRIVAAPDLHTVGACTGRVMAMASPKAKGLRKPYNWARVIRHELTHVFNLDQTQFRVPHWFTEGLAVSNEGFPRPAEWTRILASRYAADDLLTLKTIDLGFVRPRSPDEWTLAYCQAQIYLDHLISVKGPDVVIAVLEAFRDGRDTPAALQQVGVNVDEFEKSYRDRVKAIVGANPRLLMRPRSLSQLEADRRKNPDDVETAAALAEMYLKRRRVREARELAETVLEKLPNHGLAVSVKAQLLINAGEDDEAEKLLTSAGDDPRTLKLSAKLLTDTDQPEKAVEVLERGRKLEPADPAWLEELARAYKSLEETDKRAAVLAELCSLDPDDLDRRRELAKLHADAGRWAEAVRWATECVEIDATDAATRELLPEALRQLGRIADAQRWQKILNPQ